MQHSFAMLFSVIWDVESCKDLTGWSSTLTSFSILFFYFYLYYYLYYYFLLLLLFIIIIFIIIFLLLGMGKSSWHFSRQMALNAQQLATTNRIGNTRRAFQKTHFNLCFERKRLKSVKWIKSYFILKMEINKEKIRYILQYHYDKGKNAAQACEKNLRFTVKILYQNQQHGNGSLAFVLKISMWKMNLALVDQSLKNPMKSW